MAEIRFSSTTTAATVSVLDDNNAVVFTVNINADGTDQGLSVKDSNGVNLFAVNPSGVVQIHTGLNVEQALQANDGIEDSMGNQVVGEQQAAISNATTPADAVTKLNSLLNALRSHGLIAS